MSVYRLDPINPNHPSWRLSTEKECVWVGARTAKEARDLAAERTSVDTQTPADPPRPTTSPWQDETLTSCVWEPTITHVRAGTVERADGSIVGG